VFWNTTTFHLSSSRRYFKGL